MLSETIYIIDLVLKKPFRTQLECNLRIIRTASTYIRTGCCKREWMGRQPSATTPRPGERPMAFRMRSGSGWDKSHHGPRQTARTRIMAMWSVIAHQHSRIVSGSPLPCTSGRLSALPDPLLILNAMWSFAGTGGGGGRLPPHSFPLQQPVRIYVDAVSYYSQIAFELCPEGFL